MDESLSFGTIGATGRGVTEHYGVDRQVRPLYSDPLWSL